MVDYRLCSVKSRKIGCKWSNIWPRTVGYENGAEPAPSRSTDIVGTNRVYFILIVNHTGRGGVDNCYGFFRRVFMHREVRRRIATNGNYVAVGPDKGTEQV